MVDSDVQDVLNDIGRHLGLIDYEDEESQTCELFAIFAEIDRVKEEHAAEIARLKADRDQWKSIADEGRKAGREEALQIVLAEDPEGIFEDAMRSHEIGETGEWGTSWDEQKLREKFDVQPGATRSVIDRADEMYWSTREEVDHLKADAAKDAECIAELARELEDSFGVAETRKFGVERVNGKWERVK